MNGLEQCHAGAWSALDRISCGCTVEVVEVIIERWSLKRQASVFAHIDQCSRRGDATSTSTAGTQRAVSAPSRAKADTPPPGSARQLHVIALSRLDMSNTGGVEFSAR